VGTAPAVTVGEVLWYIQGQYNSSSITIDGVAPNTTAWTGPIAASIFQDIRSDNWNGSNPPTFGIPATYGTAGYYISRTTGNCYFNNGIFRGDINTSGQGKFSGQNNAAFSVPINGTLYPIYYSAFGQTPGVPPVSGQVNAGVFGQASSLGSLWNVGVIGDADNNGIGVVGDGNIYGGFFSSTGVALSCRGDTTSSTALQIQQGSFQWFGYTWVQPTGSTTTFMRNDGTWSTALITAPTNSGTATVSAGALNILGSTSTGIVGAYVGSTGAGNTVTLDVRTTSPSDIRLKEDIQESDVGLDFVKKLRPVSYKLKADPKHQKGYGFIAQEVETLVGNETSLVYFEPDWQVGDEKGFNTIHYPSYIAVLTKAIQELTAKVESLETKLQASQNKSS